MFDVGYDNVSISTIDPAGIALAAIQELHERTKQIDALSEENEELRDELQELRRLIEAVAQKK